MENTLKMGITKTFLGILTGILLFAMPATAGEWKLDPGHSGVMFETRHLFSTVRGQFNLFSANVSFDPKVPENSKIRFEVDVDSINTQNNKRDQHLRSKDFFNTSRFPKMSFVSKRIRPGKKGRYILEGQLTIKDVTRDVTLDLVFLGKAPNPFKPTQIVGGFESRFALNRLEFQVGNGRFFDMGVVDKDIDILISVEMFETP